MRLKSRMLLGWCMKNIVEMIMDVLGVSRNTDEYKWTQTRIYQRRIEWVKNFWIFGGVVMLIVAQPAFILASSLFLSFLSLAFLEK